jgi:hypothetical protein
MHLWRFVSGLSLCAFLLGCAQVPTQSVELSLTIGRDLQELQRSHRKAIDLLHDRDVERVDHYIEQVIVPTYVKTVVDKVGPLLSQDLSKAMAPYATQADKDRIYDEIRKTVLGISLRVERERLDLISPIEDSRKAKLQELDMAYAQMQQANSVLTAHLASVAKVNSVQDELLDKAGLVNFRQKVGESALSQDKKVEETLNTAKDVNDAISKLKTIFNKNNE